MSGVLHNMTVEVLLAASNALMEHYVNSYEYKSYKYLQEGNLERYLDMVRGSVSDGDRAVLEQNLTLFQEEFFMHHDSLNKSDKLIKENGFEEYFLRDDVKATVMAGVFDYLLKNPEGTYIHCPHSESQDMTLAYAFKEGITRVLTSDQLKALAQMARENDRSNQTWREATPFEKQYGIDHKLDGFIFNQLTDFVIHLYVRHYQEKGSLF